MSKISFRVRECRRIRTSSSVRMVSGIAKSTSSFEVGWSLFLCWNLVSIQALNKMRGHIGHTRYVHSQYYVSEVCSEINCFIMVYPSLNFGGVGGVDELESNHVKIITNGR